MPGKSARRHAQVLNEFDLENAQYDASSIKSLNSAAGLITN
jgi:hypothetical protein